VSDREAEMNRQALISLGSDEKEQPNFSVLLLSIGQIQDKAAFADLFQHFAPRVKSYMLKLGSADEMAEELAQQTLLQVWRKAQLFDPDKAAASTWIFRIARNIRIDVLRKQKHFFDDDFDLAKIEDEQEDAEVKINREQKSRHVAFALAKLPQDQAKIIRMSFYDGLSHGEIAKQLELPLGTVKSRIRLAFGRLRESVYLESGEMA
jgi:RNA polymerase sigma-70 factor (ECF subfamily)